MSSYFTFTIQTAIPNYLLNFSSFESAKKQYKHQLFSLNQNGYFSDNILIKSQKLSLLISLLSKKSMREIILIYPKFFILTPASFDFQVVNYLSQVLIQKYKREIKKSKQNILNLQINTKKSILEQSLLFNRSYFSIFILGSFDFHTIFRFLAIKSVMQETSPTVDVGSGCGDMLIELTTHKHMKVDSLIYDSAGVKSFNSKIEQLGITNISVKQDDAQVIKTIKDGYASQLFLIDVLEHVVDDQATLRSCFRVLKKEAHLIISVPTPYYPYFFGQKFDESVGHKRHYCFSNIEPLLKQSGFQICGHFYYTAKYPSLICKFFYNKLKFNTTVFHLDSLIKSLLTPLLALMSLLKEEPTEVMADHSSLLVVCKKP